MAERRTTPLVLVCNLERAQVDSDPRAANAPPAPRPPSWNPFTRTVAENWCDVLGENLLAWPLPWAVGSVQGAGLEFRLGNMNAATGMFA